MIAYNSPRAIATPLIATPLSFASFNCSIVYLFGGSLTQLSWKKAIKQVSLSLSNNHRQSCNNGLFNKLYIF